MQEGNAINIKVEEVLSEDVWLPPIKIKKFFDRNLEEGSKENVQIRYLNLKYRRGNNILIYTIFGFLYLTFLLKLLPGRKGNAMIEICPNMGGGTQ